MNEIQNQIRLPISVAMEVVMQGIKIRLGRSAITITGVVCGIAFLMSILTGQLIKNGVHEEDALREEVVRIRNFMKSDLPALNGKTVQLRICGPLSEVEMRVLESLSGDDVQAIEIKEQQRGQLLRQPALLEPVDTFSPEADIVLAMGQGSWSDLNKNEPIGQRPFAYTVPDVAPPDLPEAQVIKLARKLTEDEKARNLLEVRQDRFRNIWIGCVSLLVTVIGITNAMLMSVTERFREIGTMKCLGALSAFIRQIFLLESLLMGLVGSLAGTLIGFLFSFTVYTATYGLGLVTGSLPLLPILVAGAVSVVLGVILSVAAALYPAQVASNMVPSHALRSNI